MSFKTCRQLIHEDFRKVLTQQPHGKISEYLCKQSKNGY